MTAWKKGRIYDGDWKEGTAMGLVHGPTDENTRETGKTGTRSDTENTVSAAT